MAASEAGRELSVPLSNSEEAPLTQLSRHDAEPAPGRKTTFGGLSERGALSRAEGGGDPFCYKSADWRADWRAAFPRPSPAPASIGPAPEGGTRAAVRTSRHWRLLLCPFTCPQDT
jgi:hypothetical protein